MTGFGSHINGIEPVSSCLYYYFLNCSFGYFPFLFLFLVNTHDRRIPNSRDMAKRTGMFNVKYNEMFFVIILPSLGLYHFVLEPF